MAEPLDTLDRTGVSLGPVGPLAAPGAAAGHYGRWLARRLALGVLILFAVSIVVFVATQALPSSPARAILGRTATPQAIAALNEQLGLNRPVVTQYTTWLGHFVTGNFGESLAAREPVSSLIGGR